MPELYDYFVTENIIDTIVSKVMEIYTKISEKDIEAFKTIIKNILNSYTFSCNEELHMCEYTQKYMDRLHDNLSDLIVKYILASINIYMLNKELDKEH
jgi:hypothetical protein